MNKYEELKYIKEYPTWDIIKKIHKGWSQDDKYYIKNKIGQELLLRVSYVSNLDEKKKEYETLCEISKIKINMSMPISFGTCSNNTLVYSLFTWVSGNDAEIILPNLSIRDQYELGVEAGKILKLIHDIPAPKSQQKWSDRFNKKIDRNIRNYNNCGIVIPHGDKITKYINDNRYLLEDREQTIQHGDFHVGNLIITEDKNIGVIDFNRNGFGDPWEEFDRIVFSLNISIPFVVGQIHGYFTNNIPDKFFKLMALYIASSALSSVPWAIPFGQAEVEFMLSNITKILEYYDYFNTYKPTWYKSRLFNEA